MGNPLLPSTNNNSSTSDFNKGLAAGRAAARRGNGKLYRSSTSIRSDAWWAGYDQGYAEFSSY